MSRFISWIEVGAGNIKFLTGRDIFESDRGQLLQARTAARHLVGHGSIRFYYRLRNDYGTNRECTDFSSPDNFPSEIVAAIKAGEFRGLGTPQGLLLESAWAKYHEVEASSLAAYNATERMLLAEYRQLSRPVSAVEHQDTQAAAWTAHQAVIQPLFWDLFAVPENRADAWKSSPDNFPPGIMDEIKAGAFRGLGTPRGLLSQAAWTEYKKAKASAWAKYEKVRQAAWAEYEKIQTSAWAEHKQIEASAWAEFKKTRHGSRPEYETVQQASWTEYKKAKASALAKYETIEHAAWAEYEKIEMSAFWDLFSVSENRADAWK